MNKSILQVLKMILALAGGGVIGLTIALLFTGTSINELITKFSRVDWAETVGAGAFSILAAFAALDKDIHSKKAFINQLTIHAHTQQGTRPRNILSLLSLAKVKVHDTSVSHFVCFSLLIHDYFAVLHLVKEVFGVISVGKKIFFVFFH